MLMLHESFFGEPTFFFNGIAAKLLEHLFLSSVTFIYVALYTIEIGSEQFHGINQGIESRESMMQASNIIQF